MVIFQTIINELKANAGATPTDYAKVLGYYTAGDGGGDFYWDANNVHQDNGGTVIQPISIIGANPGRWIRVVNGTNYYSKWWGLHLDGLTDDSLAIQNACDYIASVGGGKLELSSGKMWFQFPVFITNNIEIAGQGIDTHI
jgi:hypothetical protein